MRDLNEILEQYDRFSTVLIARKPPADIGGILEVLFDAGINVIGPVERAAHALAIAAQTHVDLALVTPELAGRRDGAELARRLADTWGVRTVVVPEG